MAISLRPTILYVGKPIQHAHEKWAEFREQFNLIKYERGSKAELISAFAEGGKYSQIDGIVRPNNSDNNIPALDRELIAALPPTCKIVASTNHGYEQEDTEELSHRGIWYCNGAGGANDSTADIALFLLIAVFRYTTFCERRLRELRTGDYFSVEEVVRIAHNPRDHVLGIVGMGEVGIAVATRALSLGMKIHYFSRTKKSASVEKALGDAAYHATLESLLQVSDCVLLACPHTPETHHLLNSESLAHLKHGARVVNIGRGPCIDEGALAEALDDGRVSSAGLDVYHDEPVINPRLLDNYKITLTPHIGGVSADTVKNFERIAMENIEEFFLGSGKVLTPVNKVEPTSNERAKEVQ